jgi:hypothetical protein
MNRPTARRKGIDKAITALLPMAPLSDVLAIRAICDDRKLRGLPPSVAAWLATTTHVRHVHTDYESLLAEGYDREAARFFVVDAMNAVLTRWRATRLVDTEEPRADDE